MVEEIVREHFTALDTSGSVAEGGTGSQRDAAENDLKVHVNLWELEDGLNHTDQMLEGCWYIASVISPVALMVVSDARERTRAALRRVQEAINAESEA